jgi:hypothetical protein
MCARFRLVSGLILAAIAASSFAVSADDANKSNNPLNPAPGLNFQDYYVPSLFSSDKYTNDFLLRGTLPVAPGALPTPQLIRATVPISTRPAPDGGYSTALGDLNLFDIFLMGSKEVQVGAGPLLTMPTATHDELGTGKWQAGLAAVVVNPTPERLLGALVQWQHSFAGDSDRLTTNTATVQPFLIYNLPEGWYLRSTATWTFNLNNGEGNIPVGFGAGKVWRVGKTVYNAYLEPQGAVWHEGAGQPHWTMLGGLNITLGNL